MTPIVGLLPVSARRLYVYWEAPRRFHGRLTVEALPGVSMAGLGSKGGCFIDFGGDGSAMAELRCGGELLASSGAVETPSDAAQGIAASW